jgi:hypothetical protein
VTGWWMYRLSKAKQSNEEWLLPSTVHWRDAREIRKPHLFLLSRLVLGVHENSHSPRWSTQDNIYLPLWDVCI